MYSVVLGFKEIQIDPLAERRFETRQFFGEPFDFNFPFRPLLDFIAECLHQTGCNVSISLPEFMEFEDFMTGELRIDDKAISVYFEHSLSFLEFASNSREDLQMLVTASEGKSFEHKGYGLEDAKFG